MTASTHEFNTDNFDQSVLRSDRPVLVDFWAEWCQPCRAIAPTIDRIAERFGERATVGKVDIDANAPLAATYAVQAIPTILLFQRGEPVKRFVGLQSEQAIADAIDEVLHANAA
jgi:thioredoxin 1